MNVGKEIIEVKNRIAYQLAWSVIGDVTPSINFVELCPLLSQLGFVNQ